MKPAKKDLKKPPHPTQAPGKQVPPAGRGSSPGTDRKSPKPTRTRSASPIAKTLRSPSLNPKPASKRLLPGKQIVAKRGASGSLGPKKAKIADTSGSHRTAANPPKAPPNTLLRKDTTNAVSPTATKSPDHYRRQAFAVQSPSELSFKTITEHYELTPVKSSSATTAARLEAAAQDIKQVFKQRGYLKQAKIDEGAFGVVSKLMRLSDKTIFAVKEVDLSRKRAKRIEEMKRELFMLQRLESEFVVKLIEHFLVDQTLVIIMEYCAGNNLTAYLKDTAINEKEARQLFIQMALSIKILHKNGFAHRDVKLNNFLLDGTRRFVKISDFGLSVVSFKRGQGIFNAKTYCGTEPYMAPEILRRNSLGLRSYNPVHSDIWSLGICLFAMLTRTFPFKQHNSQQGLFRAQVNCRWKFPKTLRDILSEEIKDLVWHMLDPNPERRITINGILAHPWINQNQLYVLSPEEAPQPAVEKRLVQRSLKQPIIK